MLWIGITGPMGSGKSTVSRLLREMGYTVLDADQIATGVLNPGSEGEVETFRTFGEVVKDTSGRLDRRALGRLVFGDAAKLRLLEEIIHPRVRTVVAERRLALANAGHVAAFYDVPLLFEKNMQQQFDHILVVRAGEELRAQRVMARSSLTAAEIAERNAKHIPPSVKEAAASAIISNEGSIEELKPEILRALRKIGVPLKTLPSST